MQSKPENKFDGIKDGKYEFLIQGVVRQDSNGYDLKMKNGQPYQKLRILLLSGEKNHYIYKPIFSIRDVKEIVLGISNHSLTFVFESDNKNFELEALIGEVGTLFLGHKESNGVKYPQVECFIQPKRDNIYSENNTIVSTEPQEEKSFKEELNEADEVPF